MDLTPYLLTSFNILANSTVSINGGSAVPCIFNYVTHAHQKDLNYVEDGECSIVVRTQDILNAKSLIGKQVLLRGETWRITRIQPGEATTNVYLTSKDRT